MKKSSRMAIVFATAVLFVPLLVPVSALGQALATANLSEKSKAARAKRNAEAFQTGARVLTVYDRQGKVVTTVGERGFYNQPVFSPDRTRIAVSKFDPETESSDLWVLDVAKAKSTRITSGQPREFSQAPAWSPDGRQMAYVALRGGNFGLYRKAANGEGAEELLYKLPGIGTLTDWSADGRFLVYFATDLSGGTFFALPLGGDAKREPIAVFRSESQVQSSCLSPDGRFLSYTSNESGRNEIYVRPFDPSAGAGAASSAGPWRVSDQGGQGLAVWRPDGKELYYVAADRGVMAVQVTTAPRTEFGKPRLLFRAPEAVTFASGPGGISRDGERVVMAAPPTPTLRQITIFDRQGSVVRKIGEPGLYVQPALSPDGTRVALMRTDPRTGNGDIWAFDVATSRGIPVTNDVWPENAPIWSPDGSHVAYVSTRRSFASIFRKTWDGTGQEEQLFRYTPGAGMVLTDWSADGRFLTFHSGVVSIVSLDGNQNPLERKAIDWLRDEYDVLQGRFSPDSRFMAYLSNEIEPEIFEVYVRPFDAGKPEAGAPEAKPVQVSKAGALGLIFWRQDGKELYYLTPDWEVMAVDVTTTPTFQAGTPKLLFKLSGPLVGNPTQWRSVSRDGQRFVFAISVPVSETRR